MQLPSLPPRYLPLRRLGEGATGHVWEARDSRLDLSVAVKIVRPNLAKYARFRARFAREVALSARIIHPRMVPVYDYGSLGNGCPYVVMGLADQGCLGQLLRWGPPLAEVLRMVDQVLEALAALHARGLVHQDLKPENVLLYNNPLGEVDAWVADLGVAGTFSELAMVKRGVAGTPEWMAPEQLSRRPQELGPWTDLYAVGRMLHDILGGEPTPPNLGPKQLLQMRLQPPKAPPDVPDAIGRIIVQLLDPDPRQRYDRAADVRRALRDAAMRIEDGRVAHGGVNPGSTTFPVTMLEEVQASLVMPRSTVTPSDRVPRWNRVPPDPMPAGFPSPYRELPPRASLALFALRPTPLVGREDLQQFLWQKAREVVERQGPRVVLVVGPSGSGKAQLIDSVAVALEEGGYMETIRLRYHQPSGLQDGYQGAVREILAPWHDTREQMVQRVQRWLGRDRQVAPEQAVREAEVLTRWCGYGTADEATVNAAVGLAFLYRHLDARAWRGGAALVLEDAHLARAAGDGLAICEALLDHSVGQRPVLAIVSLASEALENEPALAAKISALEARGAMRINAARMTLSEVRQMMVQGLWMSPDLASALAPLCAGSPANAALLMRDLASRSLLHQGKEMRTSLKPEADPSEALPPSLAALFERRLEGVLAQAADPDAAAEALAAAALAGQDPPVSLIRGINAEGLDSLFASGVLRQQGWLLRFEHDGVARAARKRALSRPDLADLHRRLAEGWAALGETTGGNVDTYKGSHWLFAGDAAQALSPLLRATRIAIEEGRAEVALDASRMAITAADRVGAKMGQIEARHQAADALLHLDRPAEALAMVQEAVRLGKLDRRSDARLRVLAARAKIAQGRLEDGRQLLESASADFLAVRDRQGLIDTFHGQGVLYRLAGQPRSAAHCFRQMLKLNSGDPRTEVQGIIGLIDARIAAGKLDNIDKPLRRLRRTARQSGDTRNIARSTYTGGLVQLRLQQLGEAERYFLTARALAATLGADRLQLACLNSLGEVYRTQGDHAGAERCYQRSVRFAEERRWDAMAAVARLNLALLYLTTGAVRLSRAQADKAAELLAEHPQHYAWLSVGLLRALWAAEAGDEKTCRAWWAVAIERGLKRMRNPDLWLPLQRLNAQLLAQGWDDLAQQATGVSMPLQPQASVSIEE